MKYQFKIIEYNSEEYKKSVKLRDKILRKPLGLFFTEDFLAQDKHQINIGCFLKNEIVGVLILKKIDEKTLKMRQVAVDDTLQGKGIGRDLVNYAEIWAKNNRFDTIELNARVASINFYLKLNYKILSEEFIEVGIPHKKMMKKL